MSPRPSRKAECAGPLDDDQTVALSLRRIDAKTRLLAPRVEFERTMLSRVDAEQAADRVPGQTSLQFGTRDQL